MQYMAAGIRPWNRIIFDTRLRHLKGSWTLITSPEELERVYEIQPRYIFFLHWSERVPEDIVENFECVCFHPAHLPFGRGGTPIQNLIMNGFTETKLTAFKMTNELDAGPIYLQFPLSLEGPLHQIFAREMSVAADMVFEIVRYEPKPVEQEGEPTYFRRRKPEESKIECNTSQELYDHIRMLDAEGYSKAFLEDSFFTYEFSNAELHNGKVIAKVSITKK